MTRTEVVTALESLGETQPFLEVAEENAALNWSDDLEQLHAEMTRVHLLDRLTRWAVVEEVRRATTHPEVVVDLGCSSGYLLDDLERAFPDALLVGIDLVAPGLLNAHSLVPNALLVRSDAAALPLPDGSVEVVVSANLLEHVPDDVAVLREIRRVLRPRGLAVIVVPHGPELFDYYDEQLGHVRRYGRGELARKAASAGFEPIRETALGSVIYPAFWLRKKVNRRAVRSLSAREAAERVRRDIAKTRDSRVGRAAAGLERRLFERGVNFRAGIRRVLVLRPSVR